MKNDTLSVVLNWATAASICFSVFLCVNLYFMTKTKRDTESRLVAAQNRRAALNMLVNDLVEYSQHNPDIDPVLEGLGFKKAKAAAGIPAGTPAKPSGK